MQTLLLTPSPDRDEIIATLSHPGHVVLVAETAAQAAGKLAQGSIELVVLDLAAADGLKFLRKYVARRGPAPVVCIADRRHPEASTEALRHGVADIIGRPVRRDDVLAAMANAKEAVRVARTAAPVDDAPPPQAEGVFGASPAMRDVLAMVRRVALSRCGVLIAGERGTGREMIARAVHEYGPRRGSPFIKVVCADASSPEMDQVLNGGPPPGATVYLEDLEELPVELQLRLDPVVSGVASGVVSGFSRTNNPVASGVASGFSRTNNPVASGVASGFSRTEPPRFIAGVPPTITDLTGRGAVRGSLVDALGVVRIDLPPLRQRAEDVPLLAMHFLKDACRRADQPSKTFSRSALTLLAALPWPGNAGELRSLTERLAVLVPRGIVLLEDVLANVKLGGSASIGRNRGTLKDAREEFERAYVTAVLQHHHGRMGAAARELGIERTNLYRKIKQLKILWE